MQPVRIVSFKSRFRFGRQLPGTAIALLLTLVCCCILFLLPGFGTEITPAQAANPAVGDLQQWQKKLDHYRVGVTQQRRQIKQLEDAARDRLGGLRQNIEVTSTRISDNEAKLQQAIAQLQGLQTSLATAEKAYQSKQDVTVARLRFLQRRRNSHSWLTLLQSQSLNEFLDRQYQLRLVYQADQQILLGLKQEADQIQAKKSQVEQQKQQIAYLTQSLQEQKKEFETQAQAQEKLVSRLNSDHNMLEAAEDQLANDSEKIKRLIQQQLAVRSSYQGGIVVYGTGQLSWPASGPITSTFGWRLHPVLGSNRFHSGTDFGAEHGAPIRAADRGTVIFAGDYGGYGNTVIVDHGNGLSTLYGHASELYVQPGQVVQRGQQIAAVGSTGLSTGPHLHFEVRQNGEPIDPLALL